RDARVRPALRRGRGALGPHRPDPRLRLGAPPERRTAPDAGRGRAARRRLARGRVPRRAGTRHVLGRAARHAHGAGAVRVRRAVRLPRRVRAGDAGEEARRGRGGVGEEEDEEHRLRPEREPRRHPERRRRAGRGPGHAHRVRARRHAVDRGRAGAVSAPLLLLTGAATGGVESLTLHEWFDRWHEFYLMAGTAAVTLAGLLFVALSLHLDRLVDESHEHLLALARVTLVSFTMVLFASM